MSMTLEQAIKHAEDVAETCMLKSYKLDGDTDTDYLEQCAAEHKQLAAYLRELQERRKEPEIIHCSECIHKIDIAGQSYVGCLAHGTYPDKEYFCGNAERRTGD